MPNPVPLVYTVVASRLPLNYKPRIKFTYLTDLKLPELLETMRHLPIDTVILYTSFSQDADGVTYIDATQMLPSLASAANAPFFVLSDSQVGHGPVGGYVFSMPRRAVSPRRWQ